MLVRSLRETLQTTAKEQASSLPVIREMENESIISFAPVERDTS